MRADRRRVPLGRTAIGVSPLCFGTIPLGPLRGMPEARASDLLRRAFELGVNFVDTAEIYGNYGVIRRAARGVDGVVVATKSYAWDGPGMLASLEKARREMDRDAIDLFLLHEIESAATLRGHKAALDFLFEARARGQIRAVGVSTHTVAGVRAACALPELDVLHPLINLRGLGIMDGTAAEMAGAISTAADLGLGVYAMKALAGGHLRDDPAAAISYVLSLPGVSSVAVGLSSLEELQVDWAYCLGLTPPAAALDRVAARPRRLLVEYWCRGCGNCVASCPFGALEIRDGKARVDADACMLCGYCAGVCPGMCLKVV